MKKKQLLSSMAGLALVLALTACTTDNLSSNTQNTGNKQTTQTASSNTASDVKKVNTSTSDSKDTENKNEESTKSEEASTEKEEEVSEKTEDSKTEDTTENKSDDSKVSNASTSSDKKEETSGQSASDKKKEEEAKHTHSYSKKVTKATCTKDGYTTYTCSCGDSYKADATSAKGHSFGSWVTTKKPTILTKGTAVRTCSTCKTEETKSLPKTSSSHTHDYKSSVTTKATCSKAGVKTFTCSCGDSYTESINKTSHSYTAKTVAATCTEIGYTLNTCSGCGTTNKSNTVSALGHNHTGSNVAATCTSQGYTKYSCTRCSNTYNGNYTNALGHSYSVTSNTASCGKNGTKTETCSRCGNQKTSTSQGTSHTLKTETKAATCGSTGYEKTYCTTCGTQTAYKELPKNNTHSYAWLSASDTAYKASQQANALENYSNYSPYSNLTYFNAYACQNCFLFNPSATNFRQNIVFKYNDWTMASWMLEKVNALRRSTIYDDDLSELTLTSEMMYAAQLRAQELTTNFTHNSITDGENIFQISNISNNIIDTLYTGWYKSDPHRESMVNERWKYFGFAVALGSDGNMYAVEVFSKDNTVG
jgi:hypothetical protein